jgi:hypothetical protein
MTSMFLWKGDGCRFDSQDERSCGLVGFSARAQDDMSSAYIMWLAYNTFGAVARQCYKTISTCKVHVAWAAGVCKLYRPFRAVASDDADRPGAVPAA